MNVKILSKLNDQNKGSQMHKWASDLFPLNRSLTGVGTLETLQYLQTLLPGLEINSIESGSEVFDWTIPKVWNIEKAFIKNMQGEILIDFINSNLHVMGYSNPVDGLFSRDELLEHVHFLREQPAAIPYVTSYYKEDWAFCMSFDQWETLGDGPFHVLIDSHKDDGKLNYGEIFIPGSSKQEILFSTYICHPSMANNELSGPVVLAGLIQELLKKSNLHYSYRAIFVPETIGSLVYLDRHLMHLKDHLIAGWVLTCVGDEGPLSFIPSRLGNTYADKVTLALLRELHPDFKSYSWLDRGSDERQFCAPGVDLPVCSVTKTKYGEYAEYHTSLDDLNFITPRGLAESLDFYKSLVNLLENNRTPKINTLGEPQLGKRNLYPNTSIKSNQSARQLLNIISFLDGRHNIKEIAELLSLSENVILETIKVLQKNDLVR